MKRKGRYQFGLFFGIFCVFVILPCGGYGANLTIGNTISATGIYGASIEVGSPVYVNSSGQLGTVTSSGSVNVDCSATPPQSLQSAVNAAQPGDTINVTGTCNENITISEDKTRLTLNGQSGATISGPNTNNYTVIVRGKGIVIQNFVITEGGGGILVNRGSTAVVNNNNIYNTLYGITIIELSHTVITYNTIQYNSHEGITVGENSTARIGFNFTSDLVARWNLIQNNGGRGIIVTRTSNARIIGNTISDNGSDGIGVFRLSQADIANNTINNNGTLDGGHGINVGHNSGVQLGEDNPTTIFDQPNTTTVNNAGYGINCGLGAYVRGHLGSTHQIMGSSGQTTNPWPGSCPQSLVTP